MIKFIKKICKLYNRKNFYSINFGIFFAFIGGFIGIYSYIICGHIYSNGLTGDLLFFVQNLESHDYFNSFKYLLVIISFIVGAMISEFTKNINTKHLHLEHYQISIILEILFLILTLITTSDHISHIFVTIACGIQVVYFDKIGLHNISTVNYVGNVKEIGISSAKIITKKNKNDLHKFLILMLIVLFFCLGGYIGIKFINYYNDKAILVPIILLITLLNITILN